MHHHDLTSVPLPEQLSPNAELLDDLAELYKIFGDSTRIKILYTLFTEERGVGDIARLLGMTMSAISHQLRILKQARLVNAIPTHWDIGKVYKRLIKQVSEKEKIEVIDALIKVYNSFLSGKIDDYNSSVYYENPSYLFECYEENKIL